MNKKSYPVENCMRYYDYWIKFLKHLKDILEYDKSLGELESDLLKLVMCLDFGYCEGSKTNDVHITWCYIWKDKIFNLLACLIPVQKTTLQHKDYYHDAIIETWKQYLEEVNESIDVNLQILNGEHKGCEIE